MAMTRFQVTLGQESLFESVWKKRKSYLSKMKGYRGLYLLRGASEEDHTLYISHFIWNSKEDFDVWRRRFYDNYAVERAINGLNHKKACKAIGVDPDSKLGKALARAYANDK